MIGKIPSKNLPLLQIMADTLNQSLNITKKEEKISQHAIWSRFDKNSYNCRQYLNIPQDIPSSDIKYPSPSIVEIPEPTGNYEEKIILMERDVWSKIGLKQRTNPNGINRTYPEPGWTDVVFDELLKHFVFPCNLKMVFKNQKHLAIGNCAECFTEFSVFILDVSDDGAKLKVAVQWGSTTNKHVKKRAVRKGKREHLAVLMDTQSADQLRMDERLKLSAKGHEGM